MAAVAGGRWIALQALLLMEGDRLSATDALEQAWLESGADPRAPTLGRERGLALSLTLGVLRWELRLDSVIGALAKRGGARSMHPAVRSLLRLGLFQLIFLDRIPPRAAVSATVNLSRPAGVGFAAGFINAALRRFQREREALWPAEEPGAGASLASLATAYSHPRWMVEALAPLLGDELPALLAANQAQPPLTLRVNTLRADADAAAARIAEAGAEVEPGRFAPGALHVSGWAGSPAALPGFDEGWITVQDEASQLVALLADPAPGSVVLDACAAPGGKAAHLMALMGGEGEVFAVDVSEPRLALLAETASRLGAAITPRLWGWGADEGEGAGGDAIPLGEAEARGVDLALVDAPCSALGVVRRIPEVKRRREAEDVARQAARQGQILAAVAERVRPGGALVYSVCSSLPAEGEAVIASFLRDHGDFAVEDPRGSGDAPWHALLTEGGALRTWPHRHGCDGFFAVRMRRRGAG